MSITISAITIVLVCIILVIFSIKNRQATKREIDSEDPEIDRNSPPDTDWQLESAAAVDKVLKFTYQEHNLEKTVYCTAVFFNAKTGQYKLDVPWSRSLTLEKSSINNKMIVAIDKSKVFAGDII